MITFTGWHKNTICGDLDRGTVIVTLPSGSRRLRAVVLRRTGGMDAGPVYVNGLPATLHKALRDDNIKISYGHHFRKEITDEVISFTPK